MLTLKPNAKPIAKQFHTQHGQDNVPISKLFEKMMKVYTETQQALIIEGIVELSNYYNDPTDVPAPPSNSNSIKYASVDLTILEQAEESVINALLEQALNEGSVTAAKEYLAVLERKRQQTLERPYVILQYVKPPTTTTDF